MNAHTPMNTSPLKWAFAALATLVFTVLFMATIGLTSAFAAQNEELSPALAPSDPLTTQTEATADPASNPAENTTVPTGTESTASSSPALSDNQAPSSAAPTPADAPEPASSDSIAASADSTAPPDATPSASPAPAATQASSTSKPQITAEATAIYTAATDDTPVLTTADASHPADNGKSFMYMEISPEPLPYYSPIDPRSTDTGVSVSPYGPYYPDFENITHVFVAGEMGKSISLASRIDYVRLGTNTYSYNDTVTLPGESGNNHVMMNWYWNMPPLTPQGAYTSSPEPSSGISGDGYSDSTSYDISALGFVEDYAKLFSVPNRTTRTSINVTDKMSVPSIFDINGLWFDDLFLSNPGEFTYYAQATYVQAIESAAQDASGQDITYVTYKLCASNILAFHIIVTPAPSATLRVNLVDESGNPIPVDYSSFTYNVTGDITDMEGFAYASRSWNASLDGSSILLHRVFAGHYNVNIGHTKGEYEPAMLDTEITADELVYAANNNTPIIRTLTMRAVVPEQFTVTFVDEDGATILLAPKQYNAGTYSSLVERPASTPEKAEDEEYAYVFDHWESLTGMRDISNVTSDVTYKPVFRSIPKKNVVATATVHAAGGLFDMAKPEGVSSYGLEESIPSEEDQTGIKQSYASEIGENSVVGVFEVNLKQYNDDGTVKEISEGIGSLSLSFNVPGVADGTKLRILQIHKNVSSGQNELITHTGIVSNGVVTITLDGRLSTFIITTDEGSTADPEEGTQGGSSEQSDPQGGTTGDDSGSGTEQGGATDSGDNSGSGATEQGNSGTTDTVDSTPQENTPQADTAGTTDEESGNASQNANSGSSASSENEAAVQTATAESEAAASNASTSTTNAGTAASSTSSTNAGNTTSSTSRNANAIANRNTTAATASTEGASAAQAAASESPLAPLAARVTMPKTGTSDTTSAAGSADATATGDEQSALWFALALFVAISTAIWASARRKEENDL